MDWPPGTFPLALTQHGNFPVNNADVLADTKTALVERGFITASPVTDGGSSPAQSKQKMVVCALRYLTIEWADRDKLSCDLTLTGYSNGGTAVALAADWINQNPFDAATTLSLRALMSVAPSFNGYPSASPSRTPHLVLEGAIDEQVPGTAALAYDSLGLEPNTGADALKAAVWVYDAMHSVFAFTGGSRTQFGVELLTSFNYWHVFGEVDPARDYLTGTAVPPSGAGETYFTSFAPPSNNLQSVDDFEIGLNFAATDVTVQVGGPLDIGLTATRHLPNVSRMGWVQPGRVDWSLPVDPSSFNTISMRVAKPTSETNCSPTNPGAVNFLVGLSDGGGDVVLDTSSYALILEQNMFPNIGAAQTCNLQHFMQTVRIPMADFCSAGLFPADTSQLSLLFGQVGTTQLGELMIDSIALTNDPEDAGSACGQQSAGWECPALVNLTPIETSCWVDPTGGCPPWNTFATELPVPEVTRPDLTTFDGWVVHTPAGSVLDVDNPVQHELDGITRMCVQACQSEWAHLPEISENCDSIYAFGTPALFEDPSNAAQTNIPAAYLDGSGLFTGESVGCDLHSDCCEAFDENVCPAAPERLSPAEIPLGLREEFLSLVDPASTVTVYSDVQETSGVTGSVGWSLCEDWGDATCPLYVSSMHLEATSPIDVDVKTACPGFPVMTVDEVKADLAQPAFGVSSENVPNAAFPTGAIVLDFTFKILGLEQTVRLSNPEAVYLTAKDADMNLSGLTLASTVACPSGGSAPITVQFPTLSTKGSVERPPTIANTVPSSVGCNDKFDLTATASDPDGDLVGVRWYVDGSPLAPSTSNLWFSSGSRTIKAVATDARGAASSDSKVVTCQ